MDGGGWFLIAIIGGAVLWYSFQRSREIGKVEDEPVLVDVGEQEYRVRFTVKPKKPGVIAHWFEGNNDALIASVDARTPTGWRHVGEWRTDFLFGEYGRHSEYTITNDRQQRERLATMAVEALTE